MFGNGIGALNVYIRGSNSGDRKVWSLTGDAGTLFIPGLFTNGEICTGKKMQIYLEYL